MVKFAFSVCCFCCVLAFLAWVGRIIFDDVGGAAANSAHAWFRTSLLEMDLRIRSVQGYYCKFSLCALSTNIKAIRTHISQVVFHFDVKSNKIFRSLLLSSWKKHEHEKRRVVFRLVAF